MQKMFSEYAANVSVSSTEIRYHFIWQVVSDETITLIYCLADDMEADFLAKSLLK